MRAAAQTRDATPVSTEPVPAPLRRVLVATDLSPGSRRAGERAAWLPLAAGASLQLLHVSAGPFRDDDRLALVNEAEHVRSLLKAAGREDVKVEARCTEGQAHVEIVRGARADACDLVVVGRRARRGLFSMLPGSTAERVARKSTVPVLVVRHAPAHPYRHPVVAVVPGDGVDFVLERARSVLATGIRVDVVHAFEVPFEAAMRRGGATDETVARWRKEQAMDARKRLEPAARAVFGKAARVRVRRGSPVPTILAALAERAGDLVVVGSHAHAGIVYALLGSVAEAVLRAAPCDVLIARLPGVQFTLP
ncbi:MAG: universal stress protein [Myxococcota bacterium]